VAVKLRLMRMGKKKQPTYRVVAADSRSPRDGRFIEIVGVYDPRPDPSAIRIDNDKAVDWLRKGAQPTESVRKLLEISGAWETFSGEPASKPARDDAPAPAGKAASKSTTKKAAAKTNATSEAEAGEVPQADVETEADTDVDVEPETEPETEAEAHVEPDAGADATAADSAEEGE
jgi:small subunit ribosomal protein S16